MRNSIKRSIKSNIKVQIAGGSEAVEFAVSNQSISRGDLTLTGAAAHTFTASTGTINSIGTVSGLNEADWTISYSSNAVTCSPSGDGLANGPYSLTIPCYPEAAQGGTPINVTFSCSTTADTYTVAPVDTGSGVVSAIENAATKTLTTDYTVDLLAGEYTGSIQLTGDVFSGSVTDVNAGVANSLYNRSARGSISGGSVHITCATQYGANLSGAVDFVGSGPFKLTNLDFSLVASSDGYNRDDGGPETNTGPNATTKQLQHRTTGTFPAKTGLLVQDCRFGGFAGGSPNARYPTCVDVPEAETSIVEDCIFSGFYVAAQAGSAERWVVRRNELRHQLSDGIRSLNNRTADMTAAVVRVEILNNTLLDLVEDPDWNGSHADAIQIGTSADEVPYDVFISQNYAAIGADATVNAWGQSRTTQGIWMDDSPVEQNGEVSQNFMCVMSTNAIGVWNTTNNQSAMLVRNNTSVHWTFDNIPNGDPWIRARGSGSPVVAANINRVQSTFEAGTPVIYNNAAVDHDAQSPDTDAYPVMFDGPFVYDPTLGQTYTFRTDTVSNFRADIESVFADNSAGLGNGLGFLNVFEGAAPTLSSTSPANNATNVPIDTDIVLTFNQRLYAQTGNVEILNSADDSVIESFNVATEQGAGPGQIEINDNVVTLHTTSDLSNSQSVYVNVDSTCFEDYFGNNFAGISDKTTLTFTTESAAAGPNYVQFDGTNDYQLISGGSPTGLVASTSYLYYVNVNPTTLSSDAYLVNILDGNNADGYIRLRSTGQLRLRHEDTSGNLVLNHGSLGSGITTGTAVNILISVDMVADNLIVYFDDTEVYNSTAGTPSAALVWEYVGPGAGGFSGFATTSGSSKLNGIVGAHYLKINQTLDITQASNRRLFYDASGVPTDLSGAPANPQIQFTGNAAAWNAGTNEGTGGSIPMIGSVTDV